VAGFGSRIGELRLRELDRRTVLIVAVALILVVSLIAAAVLAGRGCCAGSG